MSKAWENSMNEAREQGERKAAKKYEKIIKNLTQINEE